MSDAMHAHKCGKCGAVWIHPDNTIAENAHKCPNCGAEELKKWLVPVGQLPRAVPHGTQIINVVDITTVFYTLYVAALLVWGTIILHNIIRFYFVSKGNGKGNGVAGI